MPVTVAQPAPAMPRGGKPRYPKISTTAVAPLTARPTALSTRTVRLSPRPAKKLLAAAVMSRARRRSTGSGSRPPPGAAAREHGRLRRNPFRERDQAEKGDSSNEGEPQSLSGNGPHTQRLAGPRVLGNESGGVVGGVLEQGQGGPEKHGRRQACPNRLGAGVAQEDAVQDDLQRPEALAENERPGEVQQFATAGTVGPHRRSITCHSVLLRCPIADAWHGWFRKDDVAIAGGSGLPILIRQAGRPRSST